MENTVKQFHNREFGSLEIMMLGGKPYFPASECARILGYRNPHKAIADHCRYLTKCEVPHPQSPGKVIDVNFIPEGDLYRLIIRSKLLTAERFEKWVFDEVLPTIRKYGAYATEDTLDEMLRSPKFTETLIRKLAEEREKSAALEELAEELAPKARYCDVILQCRGVVQVSIIAKDYGMSAVAFNRLLHKLGVQYKVGTTWLLYKQLADQGFTQSKTYITPGGCGLIHTCWTQKGRFFLYETLKECGIPPLMEAAQCSFVS